MTPTRRDFVAMLLGAPAAAALAGCRDAGPRLPPGTLIETGMRRGHAAIRDAATPSAITTWRQHRVVIVGAGISGLTAAWALRQRGISDVVVLELDDAVGGTSRGGESAVTRYPWGAHYIVAPQRDQVELVKLLGELGAIEGLEPDGTPIIDEALRCREPEERVFYRGRWYEGLYLDAGASEEDRRQLALFKAEIDRLTLLRDPDGRRAFTIPVTHSSATLETVALDQITFARWLDERGLRSGRLRWMCDYACRDDFTLTAAETSAWAGLFYFASRQKLPGVEPQSVLTWPDGNGALVRHLATGTAIERGVAVRSVRNVTAADRAGVEVIAVGEGGPFGIRAEHVIVAVPSFIARRILETPHEAPARIVPATDYGAWAVANIHLRARPRERRGVPMSWDNVFRDSKSLGYVCATHQRGRDRGATVWTWYYPFADVGDDAAATRRRLAGAGYAEWAEVVLTDLERAHPDVRAHVEHLEIAFWGHGMIRPRPGVVWDPARLAMRAPAGRVHFAHTDLSGIALFEEAFHHGLRAAAEVA